MKKFFTEFGKVEVQTDGTLMVYGVASSPTVDADGEIVESDAVRKALPDYMRFGAVREMHQLKAAGTAVEANVDEAGQLQFAALIVDPVAITKVQTGVYKGFSLGGKVTERDSADVKKITGIRLVEVSLVDRPNNPDSVFKLFKAEGDDELPVEVAAFLERHGLTVERVEEIAKAEGATLAKSYWNIAELAKLMGTINSLKNSIAFDSQWEAGTPSPVTNRLRALLLEMGGILVDLLGEELEEVSSKQGDLAMSDKPDDLKKNEGAPTPGDDLAKTVAAAVTGALEPLLKRLEALEAQPAPSKIELVVADKDGDLGKADEAPMPDGLSPIEQATWEIRKVHSTGGLA